MRWCWLWSCAALGCLDQPVRIAPRGSTTGVDRLSELGFFAPPIAAQQPAPGVVPYAVAVPLWSDGASKLRFVSTAAPLTTTDDAWREPPGTFLVKTFYVPADVRDPGAGRELVETRVIAFTDRGVDLATYRWNAEQTDAFASGGNEDVPVRWIDAAGDVQTETFHVPGTSQCTTCHDGGALGVRTPQLAGELAALVGAGVIAAAPAEPDPLVDPYGSDGDAAARATSYLDVNCGDCHRPGGAAADTGVDWRRAHAADNICRAAANDVDGRHLIIAPGRSGDSVVLARMRSSDPFVHMPRGPSHVIDEAGVAAIAAWIDALPAGCP